LLPENLDTTNATACWVCGASARRNTYKNFKGQHKINVEEHIGKTEPISLQKKCYLLTWRQGWILIEQTCVLPGMQFTLQFIEFVHLETNQFLVSISDVILTRQTCGHRSSRVAGSKRRALVFYFSGGHGKRQEIKRKVVDRETYSRQRDERKRHQCACLRLSVTRTRDMRQESFWKDDRTLIFLSFYHVCCLMSRVLVTDSLRHMDSTLCLLSRVSCLLSLISCLLFYSLTVSLSANVLFISSRVCLLSLISWLFVSCQCLCLQLFSLSLVFCLLSLASCLVF